MVLGGTFYSAMDGPGGPSILLRMVWGQGDGGAHLQYDSSTVVIATHSYSLYP